VKKGDKVLMLRDASKWLSCLERLGARVAFLRAELQLRLIAETGKQDLGVVVKV